MKDGDMASAIAFEKRAAAIGITGVDVSSVSSGAVKETVGGLNERIRRTAIHSVKAMQNRKRRRSRSMRGGRDGCRKENYQKQIKSPDNRVHVLSSLVAEVGSRPIYLPSGAWDFKLRPLLLAATDYRGRGVISQAKAL